MSADPARPSAAPAGVRAAAVDDLPAIAAIYAHYVESTAITFDLEAPTGAAWLARWESARAADRPWCVSDPGDGVVGFVLTSEFRPRAAYRATIEASIYVAPDLVGRGIGRPLYEATLREAAGRGFHVAVAGITLPNPRSVALHERLGFEAVGTFNEVGNKLGRWRDVSWWQLRL